MYISPLHFCTYNYNNYTNNYLLGFTFSAIVYPSRSTFIT